MHITFSLRRGTSTILGTLIFIGILFTAVIPMFLFMRQADTFHEQRKLELKRLDEEHSRENVDFYAYPLTDDYTQLNVRVVNKGGSPVKIVRAWINDEDHPRDETIRSMETRVLGPFTVGLQDQTSYVVKLITEKGNVFSSKAGTLYYSGGMWYTPSLGICVHIINFMGKYEIIIDMPLSITGEPITPAVPEVPPGPPGTTSLLNDNLVIDSEAIELADDTLLVKGTDYSIDYPSGVITWIVNHVGATCVTADYQYIPDPLHHYESHPMEHGDVIRTFMVDYPDPVSYTVTINRLVDGNRIELFDSPIENIKIVWPPVNPNEDPIFYILVDGDDLKP